MVALSDSQSSVSGAIGSFLTGDSRIIDSLSEFSLSGMNTEFTDLHNRAGAEGNEPSGGPIADIQEDPNVVWSLPNLGDDWKFHDDYDEGKLKELLEKRAVCMSVHQNLDDPQQLAETVWVKRTDDQGNVGWKIAA